MTAPEIINDIKKRRLKPLYLLHGEEPYFIDLVSDFAEQNLLSDAEKGFNQTVFYGKDTDIMMVLGAAKRYPMMSDYQLVRDRLTLPLLEAADAVSAYDWADDEINVLLRDLSSSMAADLEVVVGFDPIDVGPLREAV